MQEQEFHVSRLLTLSLLLTVLLFSGCGRSKPAPPDSLTSSQNLSVAEKLIDNGDYEAAYLHLNAALAKEPRNADLHEQLGWAYLENGELEKASDELKLLTELSPESPQTYYLTGALYSALEQPHEALKDYQLALKGDSENTRLMFDIGETLHKLNRDEEALASYRKALTLIRPEEKDRQGWFLFAICSTEYALHKVDEAVNTCEKALQTSQDENAKDHIQDFMQTIKLAQDLEKS